MLLVFFKADRTKSSTYLLHMQLYIRQIQIHFPQFWKLFSKYRDSQIPFTQYLIGQLIWLLNTQKGRSLQQRITNITITINASKTGTGGHMNHMKVKETWFPKKKVSQKYTRISGSFSNNKAIFPMLQNYKMLRNNKTVVQCIKMQGETRSNNLCIGAWKFLT